MINMPQGQQEAGLVVTLLRENSNNSSSMLISILFLNHSNLQLFIQARTSTQVQTGGK